MKQEDIQKALESLGKSGITIAGDIVFEKNVEHEICNVESGGIGIQIIHGKDTKLTTSDKDIKSVIEELMKLQNSEGVFLFKNKKQWWAIYRVLHTFCNYPSQMKAFEAKMKELEVAQIDGKRDFSYESLSAASKEVPMMATSSPSAWNALKDKSEHYRQQYEVAEFLMLKLGIKS